MIFEIYDGVCETAETNLNKQEKELEHSLKKWLTPFPVHRVRIRKNYSQNTDEISVDIELDSTLTSEKIYNKIVYRVFKVLQIDLITLQNNGNYSNFPYFFYGEKVINKYRCSIFIDVPSRAYIVENSRLKGLIDDPPIQ
ncbi:MAG: hypothetical protein OEZ36_12085 [Spirochaetota bacterium]|nr:hypothetical protein [Spirochaetota bacterium]